MIKKYKNAPIYFSGSHTPQSISHETKFQYRPPPFRRRRNLAKLCAIRTIFHHLATVARTVTLWEVSTYLNLSFVRVLAGLKRRIARARRKKNASKLVRTHMVNDRKWLMKDRIKTKRDINWRHTKIFFTTLTGTNWFLRSKKSSTSIFFLIDWPINNWSSTTFSWICRKRHTVLK